MRVFSKIVIGLLLLTCSAWAQDGTAVSQVESASQKLATQQADGLLVEWSSRDRVAGEAVDLRLVNRSYDEIQVHMKPGMVFLDDSGRYQPFMLENELSVNLGPNEQRDFEAIRAYNVNHSRGPAPVGKLRAYQTVTELAPYAPGIRALWAGLRRDGEGKMDPVVQPVLHKTIVLQRAIWASMEETDASTREKLAKDLMDDTLSADHPFDQRKVDWIADGVWKDVSATLESSSRE